MPLWDRFALWLWRDRGGYDPATGGMSENYNRPLLTQLRHWRHIRRGAFGRAAPWLIPAIISAAVSLVVVLIPFYFNGKRPANTC